MDRSSIRELHNIAHVENVPSILERGIMCHQRAARVEHYSVADPSVQARRAATHVPGGLPLHRYACLYIDARNAMLYRLLGTAPLCVLGVDPAVLDLDGTIVSDRNAASGTALFRPATPGIAGLSEADVYAEWWNTDRDARQKRCAEVLVPDKIAPSFIRIAYVADEAQTERLRELVDGRIPVAVNAYLFFRGSR